MLDWDTLITAPDGEMDGTGQKTVESVPACPGKMPVVPVCRDRPKVNNGGACGAIVPAVPAVPAEKTREGNKVEEKSAAGGGVAARKFAPEIEAVFLVMAVCRKVKADTQELAVALDGLQSMQPEEQVERWRQTAIGLGIHPWQVFHPKAPEMGRECTGCQHIHSAHDFIPDLDRRRFTWSCLLGYPLHLLAYGSERVLVAPPECQSWEQWKRGG